MKLTQDRNTPLMDAKCVGVGVKANAVIFAGAIVCVDATGFAVPGAAAKDLLYVGRAEDAVNATGKTDGELKVEVRRGVAFKWANDGSVNQAALFKSAFIVDDQTVSGADGGGTRSKAGIVVAIDNDGVWIE